MANSQSKALSSRIDSSDVDPDDRHPLTAITGSPNLTVLNMLSEHESGSISFTDIDDPAVSWKVYIGQGKLLFAESCVGYQDRLEYILSLLMPEQEFILPENLNASIFSVLCDLWTEHQLPSNMLQKVLAYATQEALIQIFAMKKSEMKFDPSGYFPPIIKSSSFSELIDPVDPWISQWRSIRNEIHSPFQRLFIRDWDLFFKLISYARSGTKQLHQLDLGLEKNYTLYRLAFELKMNIRELAVLLHPLIKAGAVGVRCFQELAVNHRPLVASLNQKRLDQQLTQRILERSGYDVLMLRNPHRVIQQLEVSQPALALLDSNLEQTNTFEICRQIRKVDSLQNLPIIMLMREEKMFADMRCHWAGASDYLKNPIRPEDLLQCVNRWSKAVS